MAYDLLIIGRDSANRLQTYVAGTPLPTSPRPTPTVQCPPCSQSKLWTMVGGMPMPSPSDTKEFFYLSFASQADAESWMQQLSTWLAGKYVLGFDKTLPAEPINFDE